MLFAGNLIKHPCFDEMRREHPPATNVASPFKGGDNNRYRIIKKLNNTDKIMNDTFWIGVYPGITEEKIEYILEKFDILFK